MLDSTPTAATPFHTESSSFQRTVSLHEWWLVKAKSDFQGKRIAVSGVSSRKDEALRIFVSAPVIKRYDMFSLETVDGICILLSGFINEQRTLENGFTAQVFNHFLFGFPLDWESCALSCFREESSTGTDFGSAFLDDVSATSPEILSDVVEKSFPTSLTSVEDTLGDFEKSFPENECDVSKEMGGVNFAFDSGGNRHSARLHSIRVCQQQKQPASGGAPKNPDKLKNSTSVALENCDVKGQRSPATPIQSQSQRQVNVSSEQVVKKSVSRISRTSSEKTEGNKNCDVSATSPEILSDVVEKSVPTSLTSVEDTLGDCEKSFPENECDVSKEMGGVNVAYDSGGNRRRARLHGIRVCQQQKQPASGGAPKNPDKLKNSTSVALENCDVKGQRSPATPIQSQSQRQVDLSSEQIVKKSVSRVSRTSPAKTEGNKNCDVEGLGNPATPILSRLQRKVNPSSEQIPKKSVSRFSGTLSAKSDVRSNKKRVSVETKEGRAKRKLIKSSPSVKNLQEKDVSHLVKGSKQKSSSVSAELLSFRKSKSGRLLLPPLEFWRNQIPVYNADHELTEIQEGASLV